MSTGEQRRSAAWRTAILLALFSLLLLWPAALNRSPILFSDSLGYLRIGEHVVQAATAPFHHKAAAGPASTNLDARNTYFAPERSPFYGAPIVLLSQATGGWLAILVQGLLVAITLFIAARRFGALDARRLPLVLLAMALVSGLPFFVSAIMPDLFAGLLILALALVLAFEGRLRLWENLFLYALILASALFHVTHVAVAIAIVLAAGVVRFFIKAVSWRSLGLALGVCVLAVVLNLSFTAAVQKILHVPLVTKPFLLARLISDGTAAAYLDQACPEKHYDICRFRDRFPESESDVIWSTDPKKGVIQLIDLPEQQVIQRQANEIIVKTVLHDPLAQLKASTMDALRQLTTVGVAGYNNMDVARLDGISPSSAFYPMAERYVRLKAVRDAMPWDAVGLVMSAACLLSVVLLLALAVIGPRGAGGGLAAGLRKGGEDPFAVAAAIVLFGILANAAICGALSGIFDRYQGRVAWVAVLLACAAIARRPGRKRA